MTPIYDGLVAERGLDPLDRLAGDIARLARVFITLRRDQQVTFNRQWEVAE